MQHDNIMDDPLDTFESARPQNPTNRLAKKLFQFTGCQLAI